MKLTSKTAKTLADKLTPKNIFTKSEKESIILLHGWGGSIRSLESLEKSLRQDEFLRDTKIYNLELPGFGQTKMPKKIMGTHDYATYIAKFIESEKIRNLVLIGHSFGGKIILDAVSSGIIKPTRIVLINNSGIKPDNNLKKSTMKFLKKMTPGFIRENKKMNSFFYKYILRERDYLNAKEEKELGNLKESLSKIVEENYDDILDEINIPTLLIWGEKDSYVPLWMGEKQNQKIRGSKLIVVPDATHGLPIKQPEIVTELILNWLKGKN